jgi:hypothetical protein
MKSDAFADFWGAQAASLPFAAACREHPTAPFAGRARIFPQRDVRPASCRAVQAGSLRSPDTITIRAF